MLKDSSVDVGVRTQNLFDRVQKDSSVDVGVRTKTPSAWSQSAKTAALGKYVYAKTTIELLLTTIYGEFS